MTAIVLRGSVIISIALTSLLIVRGVLQGDILEFRVLCGLVVVVYLCIGEFLARKHHYVLAGWMVMSLYAFAAATMLLLWGLNTPVGILTVGFVVFLSGIMLGPKYIAWVTLCMIALLCIVQYTHSSDYINPELEVLAKPSHYFDVLSYVTILGAFALISWLSGKQTERSLKRARIAEEKLRAEKENLVVKLEEESRRLRQVQLQEMVQLYQFAEIGQTTTATLHELSNLLSVLTLDIDDIKQQHQSSQAITNAKDGIEHINHLVRQTRRQLYDNRNVELFNAIPVIEHTLRELQPKFKAKGVELQKQIHDRRSFKIMGDALNLSHVVTILLNNASDACVSSQNPKIIVRIIQKIDTLNISVIDNGYGISAEHQAAIFDTHRSNKPSGLGIGLYVTKHIVEHQLHGKISLIPTINGAHFLIELSKHHKKPTNKLLNE